jgi:hypothetical protein
MPEDSGDHGTTVSKADSKWGSSALTSTGGRYPSSQASSPLVHGSQKVMDAIESAEAAQ